MKAVLFGTEMNKCTHKDSQMGFNPSIPSIQKRLHSLLAYDATEIFMGPPKPKDSRPGPVLKGSVGTESGPVLHDFVPAKALCLIPEWTQEEDTYVGLSSILRRFTVNLVTCDYII